MRAKTLYEVKLAELIKSTPNDGELGKVVREFNNNYKFDEAEEKAERLKMLMQTKEVIESGYAGVMPNGNIVDRREHPKAIPIQENPLFNTPKPKKI